METINRRIGYFLRETTSSIKGQTTQFLIRYFMIDNHNTIYYTDNYSHLVHLVRSSNNISEVFEKAAKLDQYFFKERVVDFKVTDIRKYKNPEHLTFLNQLHFEVLITFAPGSVDPNLSQMSAGTPTKPDEPRKHMFFSYKDHCLPLLHRFVSGLDRKAAELDEGVLLVWPGIEPFTSLARKKAESDKIFSKYAEHVSNLKAVIETVKTLNGQSDPALASKPITNGAHHESEMTESKAADSKTAIPETSTSESTENLNTVTGDPIAQDTAASEATDADPATGALADGNPQEPAQIITQEAGKFGTGGKGPMDSPKNNKDKEHLTDTLSYSGDFRNNKRHGTGYFVLADKGMGMCYVESINGHVAGI